MKRPTLAKDSLKKLINGGNFKMFELWLEFLGESAKDRVVESVDDRVRLEEKGKYLAYKYILTEISRWREEKLDKKDK